MQTVGAKKEFCTAYKWVWRHLGLKWSLSTHKTERCLWRASVCLPKCCSQEVVCACQWNVFRDVPCRLIFYNYQGMRYTETWNATQLILTSSKEIDLGQNFLALHRNISDSCLIEQLTEMCVYVCTYKEPEDVLYREAKPATLFNFSFFICVWSFTGSSAGDHRRHPRSWGPQSQSPWFQHLH